MRNFNRLWLLLIFCYLCELKIHASTSPDASTIKNARTSKLKESVTKLEQKIGRIVNKYQCPHPTLLEFCVNPNETEIVITKLLSIVQQLAKKKTANASEILQKSKNNTRERLLLIKTFRILQADSIFSNCIHEYNENNEPLFVDCQKKMKTTQSSNSKINPIVCTFSIVTFIVVSLLSYFGYQIFQKRIMEGEVARLIIEIKELLHSCFDEATQEYQHLSRLEIYKAILTKEQQRSRFSQRAFNFAILYLKSDLNIQHFTKSIRNNDFLMLRWCDESSAHIFKNSSNEANNQPNEQQRHFTIENLNPPSKSLKVSNFTKDTGSKTAEWKTELKRSLKKLFGDIEIKNLGVIEKSGGSRLYVRCKSYHDAAEIYFRLVKWRFESDSTANYDNIYHTRLDQKVKFISDDTMADRFKFIQ